MRIPEIQERLFEIASETGNDEIAVLARQLSRRKAVNRPARVSAPMTDEMRDRIRSIHERNPDMPFARIAAELNINPGRVSETLRGFRA